MEHNSVEVEQIQRSSTAEQRATFFILFCGLSHLSHWLGAGPTQPPDAWHSDEHGVHVVGVVLERKWSAGH